MKYVENNHYTGERALFKTSDTSFRNCNIKKTIFYNTNRTNVSFKMSNTREALFESEEDKINKNNIEFGNSIVDGGSL